MKQMAELVLNTEPNLNQMKESRLGVEHSLKSGERYKK